MSQTHELWDGLLKAALLGTERQTSFALQDATPVGDVLQQLDETERESALLAAAATLSLYERAGVLPPAHTSPLPEACPPETLPRPGARATTHLDRILNGEYRELLPEWLEAASRRGLRAPEELLPELLETARRQTSLRAAVARVIGQRGRWLAALNPAWKYFAGDASASDEENWQTGSTPLRMEALQRARENNPAQAREWLQSTWKVESPKNRADFLRLFLTNLGPEDEPFLEIALDDKSKGVREAAGELLSRLPSSALVQRMIERLAPLLNWKSGSKPQLLKLKAGTKPQLEVQLPDKFDEAMARDGLEEEPAGSGAKGLGAKALRLRQMLSVVPPSHWSRSWSTSPAEILRAVQGHEWEDVLRTGWSKAAQSFHDEEWLEVLLQDMLARGSWNDASILNHVAPARREAFVLAAIEANNEIASLHMLIQACDHDWSEEFSRRLVERLRNEITQSAEQETMSYSSNYHWLHSLPKLMAMHLPPHLSDEFAQNWPVDAPQWNTWQKAIHEATMLLEFHRDMRQALQIP
jgi:hypothetical protein